MKYGLAAALFLSGGLLWSAETAVPAPPVSLSTAPASPASLSSDAADVEASTETLEAKPAWLEKAEKVYGDGLTAERAGERRTARRKYSQALKLLADKADDETLLSLKGDIGALLGIEAEKALPPLEDSVPTTEVKEVTEEELKNLPPAASPTPHATYAIYVDPEDPLVKKYISLYTGPYRDRMQAALDRLADYRGMFLREIKAQNMPPELLYLPVVESECQNFALSRAGAVGLWQFMQSTARYAGLRVNYWIDERRDPEKATRAALKCLKDLYDWFDDWHLALAAYNRGLYGIQRDLEFTRSPDFSLLSKRQGLPMETEHYVPKLMACVLIGDNAASYGFRIKTPAPPPKPDEVVLDKPLDLKVAAACARTTEEVMRELNPTVRLWCTPKNGENFTLKIPAGSKSRFQAALAEVKDWTPSAGLLRYTVRKGDVLSRLAIRYRTTAAAIQRENRISNPKNLRPGQVIIIRPGRGFKGE